MIDLAPRYLVWVDWIRNSRCFCGEPRCTDPTTEAQRNRGYNLCLTSLTSFSEEPLIFSAGFGWIASLKKAIATAGEACSRCMDRTRIPGFPGICTIHLYRWM